MCYTFCQRPRGDVGVKTSVKCNVHHFNEIIENITPNSGDDSGNKNIDILSYTNTTKFIQGIPKQIDILCITLYSPLGKYSNGFQEIFFAYGDCLHN